MTFKHFVRRVPQKLRFYLYLIISIPLVLLVRILKPILHFRFGLIGVEAIGHLTTYHDIYFCEKKIGLNQDTIDIFGYHYGEICNQVLFDMIFSQNRDIIIFRHFGYALYKANAMFKGAENHIAGMKTHDYNATIMECLPIIKFSKAQEKKAKEMLKSFGVNKDFVSINARDNAYKSRLSKIYNQDVYSEKRNTDLSTYYKASRWLSKQNIGLIRIGYKVEFKTTEPCIFDYSSINLSVPSRELMDLYIQSKSQFVLIGDSGLANVSRMFRVPSLAVNLPTPIFTLNNYAPDSIFITQKYFSNKLGRNLTYAELFSTFEGEKEVEFINKLIERFDVVFIKNTEDEILSASKEIYLKLTNQWTVQDDEKELQEKFWHIFEINMPSVPKYDNYIYKFLYGKNLKKYPEVLHNKMNITIAYSFLKNNIELLR